MQKEKTNRVINFVKRHRKLFSSILTILALLVIFLPQIILKLPWVSSEKMCGIELVLYCSQIVSALFVIVGTIIAVWQYYLSSSKRIREVEFSRVEKAIELAGYFKDNVLERYSFVKSVFDLCGITSMIAAKRKDCELEEFDISELREKYSEGEIKKFETLDKDSRCIESIIALSSAYNIEIKGYEKNVREGMQENERIAEISANASEVFNDFYKRYIVQTLNNAEYFAMAFTHNIADESVIYQSIYPSFLEMCFIMYYYIAKDSDPAVSKLYTNIADLYCMWREREQEQKKEYKKGVRAGSKKPGTIVPKE